MNQAMRDLADKGALFIGQNVVYDGTAMHVDLAGVPMDQRIEFPVAEELQLGASIGMAMQGLFVVSIFPRLDFLMRAMDQLVNHLDKMELMSRGQWSPKLILRTRIGQREPLDAGPQHTQDHCAALRLMLTNVDVVKCKTRRAAATAYQRELSRSRIVVEDF